LRVLQRWNGTYSGVNPRSAGMTLPAADCTTASLLAAPSSYANSTLTPVARYPEAAVKTAPARDRQ
jgi:hypothetical protein